MADILSALAEPWQHSFMIRALLATTMVGVVCSVLGAYVVLRGMAFFGDALAHSILPGVVLAFVLGWPLAIGALVVGILAAVAIGALSSRGLLKEDTAIGVIFAGAFALGVAMLSAFGSYTVDLAHFLFGNPLGVSNSDLLRTFLLGGLVILVVFLFYKELMIVSFDPLLATTLRLPVGFFRYLLLILLAITIVVSIQIVGIALVVAMLVTPPAAALFLTQRLWRMMVIAGIIAAISGLIGLYISYFWGIAAGPAIVLVATAIFIIVFLTAPGKGLIWRTRTA
jgi:ABC-type Mn2+/Zn2+ transport system permease subunit